MPQSSPTIAPAVAPERDWADDLARDILEQIAVVCGPGRRALVAAHLRCVRSEGRVEGVGRAGQAIQEAFDAHRGRSA